MNYWTKVMQQQINASLLNVDNVPTSEQLYMDAYRNEVKRNEGENAAQFGRERLEAMREELLQKQQEAHEKRKEILNTILNGDENGKGRLQAVWMVTTMKKVFREIQLADRSKKWDLNLMIPGTPYLSVSTMSLIPQIVIQCIWHRMWMSPQETKEAFDNTTQDPVDNTYDLMEYIERKDESAAREHMSLGRGLRALGETAAMHIGVVLLGIIEIIMVVLISGSCCIQYAMAIIEFTIITTVGIILIPMMLFDGLKDMAQKLLPTLLGQCAKLMMITLCMYFATWVMLGMAFTESTNFNTIDLRNFYYVAVCLLLNHAVCSNAPKIAQALMTGQPQLSMGEFIQTAGAAMAAGHMARTAAGKAAGLTAGVAKGAAGITGAAIRHMPDALGNMARTIGAGIQAADDFSSSGRGGKGIGGKLGAIGAGMKGAAGEASRGFRSDLGRYVDDWMRGEGRHKPSGGGAGGGGGNGGVIDERGYMLSGNAAGADADARAMLFWEQPEWQKGYANAIKQQEIKELNEKGELKGTGKYVQRRMTMGEYIRQQFEAGRRNSSGIPEEAFDAHVAERRENEIKAATAAHFASRAEPEMKPMGHFESY